MDYQNTSEWRVLVIDDIEDNIIVLDDILSLNDAKVITTVHGREAVTLADSFKANIILLDLAMPDMDGWAVFRSLQENASTSAIPVIAVTANVDPDVKEKTLKMGFKGYITKPFSAKALIDSIRSILSS